MAHEDASQPRWWYWVDIAYKVAVVVGVIIAFTFVTLPSSRDDRRKSTAEAEAVEYQVHQSRRPAIQVLPTMTQSASVQDIREMRLALKLSNVGEVGATIESLEVKVDNGEPVGEAADIVRSTIDYFNLRMNTAVERAPSVQQYGAQQATYSEQTNGSLVDPLPPHEPCPHGILLAIAEGTEDLKWSPIERATQSLSQPQILRPKQSASHAFTYLLTEYPEQHHRQWLRFRITVKCRSEESDEAPYVQQYELFMSGLPLPRGQDSICAPVECSTTTVEGTVWQPDAPLMSVSPKE